MYMYTDSNTNDSGHRQKLHTIFFRHRSGKYHALVKKYSRLKLSKKELLNRTPFHGSPVVPKLSAKLQGPLHRNL
jgi:hypothetical protein